MPGLPGPEGAHARVADLVLGEVEGDHVCHRPIGERLREGAQAGVTDLVIVQDEECQVCHGPDGDRLSHCLDAHIANLVVLEVEALKSTQRSTSDCAGELGYNFDAVES